MLEDIKSVGKRNIKIDALNSPLHQNANNQLHSKIKIINITPVPEEISITSLNWKKSKKPSRNNTNTDKMNASNTNSSKSKHSASFKKLQIISKNLKETSSKSETEGTSFITIALMFLIPVVLIVTTITLLICFIQKRLNNRELAIA